MHRDQNLLALGDVRNPVKSWTSRVLAAVSAVTLSTVGIFAAAVPAQAATDDATTTNTSKVSADPLPTTQIDGVAWAQLIVGNSVYVGGKFANARPAGAAAGTNLAGRSNILAYKLSDGTLNTTFNPGANSEVFDFAASPDGSRLYVAGSFTTIGGQTRYRVAALNPTTGAVISSWAPAVNGIVRSIAVKGDVVFLGGEFTSVNNTTRNKVAAVNASTGALLPFNPTLDGGYGVRGIEVSPDGSKVVIAGSFTSVNGSTNPGRGMAALNATTGASLPWAANSIVRNAGTNASIYSLTSDGDSVYGTAYDYYGGDEDGLEGSFRVDWNTGELVWLEDCHGDTYGIAAMGDEIFTASHAHYCGNIGGFPQTSPWTYQHSISFSKSATGQNITADPHGYRSFTGLQAPQMMTWYPQWSTGSATGLNQAVWSVAANSDYLVYGGEFPKVAGSSQQGLVRFALKTAAPNKIGPQVKGGTWPLSTVSFQPGQVRLSWKANYDPDDATLTYEVQRRDVGTSKPLTTTQQTSNFWTTPLMTYTDKTVTPGQTYDYRIRVYDPYGNQTVTDWTSVTASSVSNATTYTNEVLDTNPTYYWPLSEDSGTVGYDWATGSDLTVKNAARGVTGMNIAEPGKATDFAGTTSSFATTTTAVDGPQQFSVEAWFSTTSTEGGKLIGFGNSSTGNSSSYDRHVYLSNDGKVTFGVYTGSTQTISSGAGYNDGTWHHVVASMDGTGLKLYVDDKLVDARSDVTSAQAFQGYWRVGGDTFGSWPNGGSSGYLDGNISDLAVYDRALTRAEVDGHWTASGRTSTIPAAPSDAYGKSVFDLDPTLYWRLGESSGTTAADSGQIGNAGTYRTGVTQGQPGALSGVTNTGVNVNGNGLISSNRSFNNPTTYAIETWFKTTTTAGGKIVGFGSSATGNSSSYDRHVYMTTDGKINFGTYNGNLNVITSTNALNDGAWHHVVAQQGSAGMRLYIDGVLQAQNTVNNPQNYTGYWRVGGDSSWSGANYFTGSIDEVAIYSNLLSDTQVSQHHDLGVFGSVNQPPTVSFASLVNDLKVNLDGSASVDNDGSIEDYTWDFGDGTAPSSSGTDATVSHTYTAAGTYTVTLTVTDDRGAKVSATNDVTVTEPNKAPTPEFTTAKDGLTLSVDATDSTDSDGTITTYSWAFGDGGTGLGATATHTYAEAGTYEVTLTVTDDDGESANKSVEVTVEKPANIKPTAAFTAQASNLSVALDGSASADSDGTIASYAWDFGDGKTGTGVTANHTFAEAGDYQVKLTVTDNEGATDSITQTVTATEPTPANQAPTARFTTTVSDLTVAVDASTSTDSDGTIAAYAWNFGDGKTGTGATVTHTYANAGTYTVTLTVTDDDGATGSVTSTVEVTSPASTALATDAFGRTASNGWGTADVGGVWTVTGGGAAFSVANGNGQMSLAPTHARWAMLNSVSTDKSVSEVTIASDKAFAGGAASVSVIGRRASGGDYQARVRIENGLIRMYVLRDETPLVDSYVLNGSYTPGQLLHVKLSVTGTSPTTVSAKVWRDGSAEPTNWNLTGTDNTAAMQQAGSVGLKGQIAASSTNPQTVFSFDNYQVTTDGAPAPVENVKPTAAFTSSTLDLKVSVDGFTSTDSDGTVESYAWDFGDGKSGTGKTASHTYDEAGTYSVKLTVTDDDGATDSVTKSVTVSAVPVENVKPTAAFTSSTSDLKVSVDGSTSTDSDGTVESYAWDFGDGKSGTGKTASHTYDEAGTYSVKLTVTDDDGATDSVTKSVTVSAAPIADVLAKDDFERAVSNGWGTAVTGGAWAATGSAFSVAQGKGLVTLTQSQNRGAMLKSVSSNSAQLVTTLSIDKAAAGAPMHVNVIGRQVGNSVYQARFRVEATGAIRLYILRDETPLANSYVIPNVTYSAGDAYHVTMQVTGTSPTTVSLKVWKDGATEPSKWTLSATDNTAAMQAAGSVGIQAYVSGSSTNQQTAFSIDDFEVTKP